MNKELSYYMAKANIIGYYDFIEWTMLDLRWAGKSIGESYFPINLVMLYLAHMENVNHE